MTGLMATARTLDDVYRPQEAVPRSNPDRLAAAALLLGMRPQPIDRCRVLELGCALGHNLLAMADRYPESQFVGIDDSQPRIDAARRMAELAGLKNVEFRNLNIATVDEQLGPFDYLLCSDLYGRAPGSVQDRLLAICRSLLKPKGVAYLSYRSMPGWMMPSVLEEVVRGAGSDASANQDRIPRARKLLEFLSLSLARDDSGYGRLLKGEADLALGMSDGLLAYEHLASVAAPICFHQFIDRAARHDLQYLGDSEPRTMSAASVPEAVERSLLQMAGNRRSREQYLDLLRNRSYHHSLLCHRDVVLHDDLSAGSLQEMFLAGNLRRGTGEASAVAQFVAADGAVISSPSPLVATALDELARSWPRAISFVELLESASRDQDQDRPDGAPSSEKAHELAQGLVACIAAGFVEPRTAPDRFVTVVSERPRASRWTQILAETSSPMVNRMHQTVPLDELSRNLLRFLDGQHDRATLLQLLIQATERGELSILKSGIPASGADTAAHILDQVLDQSLAKLAANALLVA